jgi:hypothetical protein
VQQSIIHPVRASVFDLPFEVTIATLFIAFGAVAVWVALDNLPIGRERQ